MTQILVLEEMSRAGIEALRAVPGFKVQELYRDEPEAIRSALAGADALIVRSKTKVTAKFLEDASLLKIIGRPGTGVDNVDVNAATDRGIIVMNTPAGNSISAAEHTMGLMLALLRKIAAADASVKQCKWEKSKFLGTELYDKTLGIIGLGKIGSEVALRAQSFKAKILAYDPYVSEEVARAQNIALVTLEDLLSQSDIISLHTPLTSSTRNLINAETLSRVKAGAFLINAARGDLVDEPALIAALKSGRLGGAALDVFLKEPKPNPELVSLPNVVATPHIAASTAEAQEKVGYDIALQIRDFFCDGIVRNAVNFPSVSLSEYRSMAPILDLAKRLGSFVTQLSQGRMQAMQVQYFGEMKEMNTRLICMHLLAGALQPIMAERITPVNAIQTLKQRGTTLIESSSTGEGNHTNVLSLRLTTDQGEERAQGTVLHKNMLRLVAINGIEIEAPLNGDMLVIRNTDTPGVIGRVGTILGEHDINIASFALGRKEDAGEAVGIVTLDSTVPEEALEEIRSLPQIRRAHLVRV